MYDYLNRGGAVAIGKLVSLLTGKRLSLCHMDLHGADLRRSNLRGADFRHSNLSYANLDEADLTGADLSHALLQNAILSKAIFTKAHLHSADFRLAHAPFSYWSGADLTEADLRNANFLGAEFSRADLSGALVRDAIFIEASLSTAILRDVDILAAHGLEPAPEGELIGWTKVRDRIVKLRIPKESIRSRSTGRICRAGYAYVLEVEGDETSVRSWDLGGGIKGPLYEEGSSISPRPWIDDRWLDYGGVSFFLLRRYAEEW